MPSGIWADLSDKRCCQCDQPLDARAIQDLGEWYHEVCLLHAKRALAEANKLADLAYVIQVYIAHREDISSVP